MPEQGAIDADFDDAEVPYEERLANALADIRTEPVPGSLAIDIVTRQLLFVRRDVADTLGEYHAEEGFDLATYGPHPWLPVHASDSVFECYYLSDLSMDSLDDLGDLTSYDFPRGRLATVPVELAWSEGGVGDV
jgi:hypothetical protein